MGNLGEPGRGAERPTVEAMPLSVASFPKGRGLLQGGHLCPPLHIPSWDGGGKKTQAGTCAGVAGALQDSPEHTFLPLFLLLVSFQALR